MQLHALDTRTATCNDCGFVGTIANVGLHDCDISERGGHCEMWPMCEHMADGDGCQTLATHTSDFYYRNPQFLHEPGSPEWYDALDDMEPYDDEPPAGFDFCKGCGETKPVVEYDHARYTTDCIECRIRYFIDGDGDGMRHPKHGRNGRQLNRL